VCVVCVWGGGNVFGWCVQYVCIFVYGLCINSTCSVSVVCVCECVCMCVFLWCVCECVCMCVSVSVCVSSGNA